MDYTLDRLDIPNIYDNKNDKFISNIDDIFEIELKPYEKRKIYSNYYAHFITNNTELYINGGNFATNNIYDKIELVNIYNKMYLFLSYGCYIENYSDKIAYVKIIIINIYTIVQFVSRYNFSNLMLFLMNKYDCGCNNERYDYQIIENIIIKTKQKIDVKYKYIDEKDILFCYKIKHIRNDLYELQISKITNKTNDKSIIIPQKNKDNIIEYYNNIYNQFNIIFNKYVYSIVIKFNKNELFNYYYLYCEVKKLDDHYDKYKCISSIFY
jgi:hypothetical protein